MNRPFRQNGTESTLTTYVTAYVTGSNFGGKSSIVCFVEKSVRFSDEMSHSGKSATIQESIYGSGVYKEHYTQYYVPKSSILLAETGVCKISSVACGFSSF